MQRNTYILTQIVEKKGKYLPQYPTEEKPYFGENLEFTGKNNGSFPPVFHL